MTSSHVEPIALPDNNGQISIVFPDRDIASCRFLVASTGLTDTRALPNGINEIKGA